MTGTVTRVFLTRGFAFVRGDEDGQDYFLQAEQLSVPWDGASVREGTRLEFEPREGGGKGNGLRAERARPC